MSLNDQIDFLSERARGTLRLELKQNNPDDRFIQISGNRSVFEFLAAALADMADGSDCKFSVAPSGPGCGWFGRTLTGDYSVTRRDLTPAEGGFYVHCHPCPEGV